MPELHVGNMINKSGFIKRILPWIVLSFMLIGIGPKIVSIFNLNVATLSLIRGLDHANTDAGLHLNDAIEKLRKIDGAALNQSEITRLIGLGFLFQNKQEEAIFQFDTAESLGSIFATGNLGFLYLQRKEWEKAVEKLNSSVCEQQFLCVDMYVTKLLQEGQRLDAVNLLEAYIRRYPQISAKPYYRLFGQYLGNQPDSGLITLLRNGLSAESERETTPYRYYSAWLASLEGNDQEAIRILLDLLNKDPVYYSGFHFLGQLYLKTGETQKSANAFEQALQLEPMREWSHYYLATAYLQLARPEDAADELWSALNLAPKNELFLDKLVAVYQQSNRLCFQQELLLLKKSAVNQTVLNWSKEQGRIAQKCQ